MALLLVCFVKSCQITQVDKTWSPLLNSWGLWETWSNIPARLGKADLDLTSSLAMWTQVAHKDPEEANRDLEGRFSFPNSTERRLTAFASSLGHRYVPNNFSQTDTSDWVNVSILGFVGCCFYLLLWHTCRYFHPVYMTSDQELMQRFIWHSKF